MALVVHLIARKAWSEQGKSNAMSLCVLITSSLYVELHVTAHCIDTLCSAMFSQT